MGSGAAGVGFLCLICLFFEWMGFVRFSASLCLFLLLLRRGDRLTRRAVTFFFAKKETHERKLLNAGTGSTPVHRDFVIASLLSSSRLGVDTSANVFIGTRFGTSARQQLHALPVGSSAVFTHAYSHKKLVAVLIRHIMRPRLYKWHLFLY